MNEIETMFAEALCEYVKETANNDEILKFDGDYKSKEFHETLGMISSLEFKPQYTVGIYIVDFAFENTQCPIKYAVEIDGHDAHKTKEQRYHDYRRERFLHQEGYTVIRFMASEVFTNAKGCVKEFLDIAIKDEQKYHKNCDEIALFQRELAIWQIKNFCNTELEHIETLRKTR